VHFSDDGGVTIVAKIWLNGAMNGGFAIVPRRVAAG
jgi:hypothetical protein